VGGSSNSSGAASFSFEVQGRAMSRSQIDEQKEQGIRIVK
jgi:hypothetical protein